MNFCKRRESILNSREGESKCVNSGSMQFLQGAKWKTRGHTAFPPTTILSVSGVRDPQKYWNGKQTAFETLSLPPPPPTKKATKTPRSELICWISHSRLVNQLRSDLQSRVFLHTHTHTQRHGSHFCHRQGQGTRTCHHVLDVILLLFNFFSPLTFTLYSYSKKQSERTNKPTQESVMGDELVWELLQNTRGQTLSKCDCRWLLAKWAAQLLNSLWLSFSAKEETTGWISSLLTWAGVQAWGAS